MELKKNKVKQIFFNNIYIKFSFINKKYLLFIIIKEKYQNIYKVRKGKKILKY